MIDGGQAMAFIFLGDLERAWGVLQDLNAKSRRQGEIWMRAFGDLFRSQLSAGPGRRRRRRHRRA